MIRSVAPSIESYSFQFDLYEPGIWVLVVTIGVFYERGSCIYPTVGPQFASPLISFFRFLYCNFRRYALESMGRADRDRIPLIMKAVPPRNRRLRQNTYILADVSAAVPVMGLSQTTNLCLCRHSFDPMFGFGFGHSCQESPA